MASPASSSPSPPPHHAQQSPLPSELVHDNPMEMSSLLSQESAPLELTTTTSTSTTAQGTNSPTSREPFYNSNNRDPSALLDDSAIVVDHQQQSHQHQQFYASPEPPSQQPQKLFDLNQLTEDEKIVLSTSGTARLYQANSQDEIDAIMQQVLDSKTTDTILIVSPVGRQIVTRNESGDQIITRVMTTNTAGLDHHHHRHSISDENDGALSFHADSPANQQIPEPVLNFSTGHHDQPSHLDRHPGIYVDGSDMDGSPPQSVIYERHIAADQIEMLNDHALRKTGRDMQDMYMEQATVAQQQQQLVYDTNNNADSDSPHDHLDGQIMKNGGQGDEAGGDEEVMGAMINDNDKPQIDLIYNEGSKTVIYSAAPTATGGEEGQPNGKSMGMYAASASDLETFIEGDHHQMVVQENGLPFGAAPSSATVYVVQEIVNDEAIDLQSGLR